MRRATIIVPSRNTRLPHRGTRAEKRRFVRESSKRARRLTASIALKEERRDFSDVLS
jgi:hypothetical protein